MGTSQVSDARGGLSELTYLPGGPGQVRPIDVDSLSYRGLLRLLVGEVPQALDDLKGSLTLARQGATLTLGLRAYFWLALTQYLAGAWDDTLLTVEQGFSAAAIHTRRFELPLLHLAARAYRPRGRDQRGRTARQAGRAGGGQRGLWPRTVVRGDGPRPGQPGGRRLPGHGRRAGWQDDSVLEGRSRTFAIWWRPLLAEGLIGSGQLERADAVLSLLRAGSTRISYLTPLLAWLDGWLAEQRGHPERALQLYEGGEDSGGIRSPVHDARLLLAHGQLLRRTGHRRQAVDRLRQASEAYQLLRAAPFLTRAEEELAACRLPGGAPRGGLAKKRLPSP